MSCISCRTCGARWTRPGMRSTRCSRAFLPARFRARPRCGRARSLPRSEEHTSELQSLMRISYAVFCLKKKNNKKQKNRNQYEHNETRRHDSKLEHQIRTQSCRISEHNILM